MPWTPTCKTNRKQNAIGIADGVLSLFSRDLFNVEWSVSVRNIRTENRCRRGGIGAAALLPSFLSLGA